MASLTSLPIELLRAVAGYLPLSGALNLTRVNRQIRGACYDVLVFKEIALEVQDPNGAWTDGERYLNRASLNDIIHTAYAIELCQRNAEATEPKWSENAGLGAVNASTIPCNLQKWLPHLLALRHPVSLHLKPEHLLHVLIGLTDLIRKREFTVQHPAAMDFNEYDDEPEIESTYFAVQFCFIALLLVQLEAGVQTQHDAFETIEEYCKTLHASHTAGLRSILQWLIPNYGSGPTAEFTQSHVVSVLPAFMRWIDSSNPNGGGLLPSFSRICLSEHMDIPIPHLPGTTAAFSQCHISSMTNPAFLEGRWIGFYSDHRYTPHSPMIDPPMLNIDIIARCPTSEDSPSPDIRCIIDDQSHGQDSHGEFLLHGVVFEDGRVEVRKLYIHPGGLWMWQGRVTPFGIAGYWGGNRNFGGYVWIWKQEWCAIQNES